jgi:hypothetical protein
MPFSLQGVWITPSISIFEHQKQKRTFLLGASSDRSSRRQQWTPARQKNPATGLDSCSLLGHNRAKDTANSASEEPFAFIKDISFLKSSALQRAWLKNHLEHPEHSYQQGNSGNDYRKD